MLDALCTYCEVNPLFPALKFPFTAAWLVLDCVLTAATLAKAPIRARVVAQVSQENIAAGVHAKGPVPKACRVTLSPSQA